MKKANAEKEISTALIHWKNGEVYLNGDPEHAGFQYRPHDKVAKGPAGVKAKYLFHKEGIDPKKDKDLSWVAMEYGLNGKRYCVQYMSDPGAFFVEFFFIWCELL